MKLYTAGIYASNFNLNGRLFQKLTDLEKEHRRDLPYILDSYHYIRHSRYVKQIKEDGCKVFLDSGAFSAFTKGVKVDLNAYCQYIHTNASIIEVASVLDAIGDAKGTYANQKAMESLGTNPLPCFHYGEDVSYLKKYIDNYEYITLGGMVPISTEQLYYWLDTIWGKYLTKEDGTPRVKVHGFGLTAYPLMVRYPWYSVDSSSWVQTAVYGSVFITELRRAVCVSSSSPARHIEGGHIENVTEVVREVLEELITKHGYNLERLSTRHESRWVFNLRAFKLLGEAVTREVAPIFHLSQQDLF